jgi:hypothetical protein
LPALTGRATDGPVTVPPASVAFVVDAADSAACN